jgi:hypothetical protein
MTDTNNGWPGKPGVPLNPEKDGPHRLRHHDSDLVLDALWSCGGTWLDLSGNFSIPHAAAFYDYLGPCLTPDEATALQARADQAAQGHAREADRADRSEFLHKQEIAALQKRVAELEESLKEAATSVKEWGAYASQYLQDKWDLPGEVARYIAVAEGKNDAALEGNKA